ncbi:MAG: NYN domain-containing protein [Methanomicrobia archaeon]|nr:NYN domain-containing protein [Methanomicrobia archaeon]
MGHIVTTGPTPSYRPVMIFIDGGYLRAEVKKVFGHDDINFASLALSLNGFILERLIHPELIRVYWYDAIVEPRDPKYDEQEEYFKYIRNNSNYEVKLGRLIKTKGNKPRQKGVDVLLAIDMITKAFLNHYEIALLLGGDDDYVDLIKSIKDLTGKRVYGAYFQDSVSERLVESFDRRLVLSEDVLKTFINYIESK